MNVNTGELFRMTPEMEKGFAKELMERDSPIKPVPNDFWEGVKKEMNPEEIENMIIPVYDKHFTEKEIDDFITFYKTDSGKKLIEKMPFVFQESQSAGQEWGRKIALKVYEKIEERSKYSSPPPPMESKKK